MSSTKQIKPNLQLFEDIQSLIEESRNFVANMANRTLVLLYWKVLVSDKMKCAPSNTFNRIVFFFSIMGVGFSGASLEMLTQSVRVCVS